MIFFSYYFYELQTLWTLLAFVFNQMLHLEVKTILLFVGFSLKIFSLSSQETKFLLCGWAN